MVAESRKLRILLVEVENGVPGSTEEVRYGSQIRKSVFDLMEQGVDYIDVSRPKYALYRDGERLLARDLRSLEDLKEKADATLDVVEE